MVFFTCNACGQAVKKAQVEKHYRTRCPQCEVLSCIDCGKDFYGDDYKQHTQCISENEKYGGKDYQVPAGTNKGEAKQEQWLQRIHEACAASSVSNNIRNLLEKIAEYPNVPRKRKKFDNFVSNSLKIHNPKIMEQVWNVFSAASSQQEDKEDLPGTKDKERIKQHNVTDPLLNNVSHEPEVAASEASKEKLQLFSKEHTKLKPKKTEKATDSISHNIGPCSNPGLNIEGVVEKKKKSNHSTAEIASETDNSKVSKKKNEPGKQSEDGDTEFSKKKDMRKEFAEDDNNRTIPRAKQESSDVDSIPEKEMSSKKQKKKSTKRKIEIEMDELEAAWHEDTKDNVPKKKHKKHESSSGKDPDKPSEKKAKDKEGLERKKKKVVVKITNTTPELNNEDSKLSKKKKAPKQSKDEETESPSKKDETRQSKKDISKKKKKKKKTKMADSVSQLIKLPLHASEKAEVAKKKRKKKETGDHRTVMTIPELDIVNLNDSKKKKKKIADHRTTVRTPELDSVNLNVSKQKKKANHSTVSELGSVNLNVSKKKKKIADHRTTATTPELDSVYLNVSKKKKKKIADHRTTATTPELDSVNLNVSKKKKKKIADHSTTMTTPELGYVKLNVSKKKKKKKVEKESSKVKEYTDDMAYENETSNKIQQKKSKKRKLGNTTTELEAACLKDTTDSIPVKKKKKLEKKQPSAKLVQVGPKVSNDIVDHKTDVEQVKEHKKHKSKSKSKSSQTSKDEETGNSLLCAKTQETLMEIKTSKAKVICKDTGHKKEHKKHDNESNKSFSEVRASISNDGDAKVSKEKVKKKKKSKE